MIELKTQYPYIGENGQEDFGLVKHYAEDGNGQKYMIKQMETGILYEAAIDLYPCKYTYVTTDIPVEVPEDPHNGGQAEDSDEEA